MIKCCKCKKDKPNNDTYFYAKLMKSCKQCYNGNENKEKKKRGDKTPETALKQCVKLINKFEIREEVKEYLKEEVKESE